MLLHVASCYFLPSKLVLLLWSNGRLGRGRRTGSDGGKGTRGGTKKTRFFFFEFEPSPSSIFGIKKVMHRVPLRYCRPVIISCGSRKNSNASSSGSTSGVAALFGLNNHLAVAVRDSPVSGRGLYLRRPAAAGDVLLINLKPIVSGKDYNECIGKVLLQKTREDLSGVEPAASTVLSVAQLTFPTNLGASVPAAEVALGAKWVAAYINKHAGGAFEVEDAVGAEAYLRIWGVLFLNAIRSPLSGDGLLHLFSSVSLINHSCFPTCALRFEKAVEGEGAAVSVVVNGTTGHGILREGAQVTIDYVEAQAERERWSKNKRKKYLFQNYGIVCTSDPLTCACKGSI